MVPGCQAAGQGRDTRLLTLKMPFSEAAAERAPPPQPRKRGHPWLRDLTPSPPPWGSAFPPVQGTGGDRDVTGPVASADQVFCPGTGAAASPPPTTHTPGFQCRAAETALWAGLPADALEEFQGRLGPRHSQPQLAFW